MSTARSIVVKLRTLASDPANRLTIVRDQGCLPGLILFLDHAEAEVVQLALEALEYLSLCDANKEVMEKEYTLKVSLDGIIEKGKMPDKAIAQRIKQNITTTPSNNSRQPLSTISNKQSNDDQTANQTFKRGGFFAQNGSNKRANIITLQLDGLEDSQCRSLVEEALLEVIGVISFTFDLKQQRIFVRTKPNVEVTELFHAILSISDDMDVKQVIRENNGAEMLVSPTVNKEVSHFEPDYLEDVYPVETSKTAITKYGEQQDASSGWFGGITSYISKSIWG